MEKCRANETGARRLPSCRNSINPAASSLPSVRARLGSARWVSRASAATEAGCSSRMIRNSSRFSGVSSRIKASTLSTISPPRFAGLGPPRAASSKSLLNAAQLCIFGSAFDTWLILGSDDHRRNAAFSQDPFDLIQEILNQLDRRPEFVRPACIRLGSMPMIVRNGLDLVPAAERRDAMGVVEAQEPAPLRIVEGQAVVQPVRPLRGGRRGLHLDLYPETVIEEVPGAIEIQEEREFVIGRRLHAILSCEDNNPYCLRFQDGTERTSS